MLNLDARLYASPRTFEEERDLIFSRSWQLIGPASRLKEPGRYVATEIAGLEDFRAARTRRDAAGIPQRLPAPRRAAAGGGFGALRSRTLPLSQLGLRR